MSTIVLGGLTPANVPLLTHGWAKPVRFSTLQASCPVLNRQPGYLPVRAEN